MRSKAAAVAVAVLLLTALPAAAQAPPAVCERRPNNTIERLLECVTVEGVREHQAALQEIADANGGTRVAGLDGYNESAQYVATRMRRAGYRVTIQEFEIVAFIPLGRSTFEQTSPEQVTYVEGVDYQLAQQTEPGDVAGPVTAVDLQLGLGNTSTSGCETEDFAGFPAGNIALIQRGTCTFQVKAENAATAGAVGVVIFNQGNTEDRIGLFGGNLTDAYSGGIPVMLIQHDLGVALSVTAGLEMHIIADVFRDPATTSNVLAESPDGNPENVVMVGAHLDSVPAGPGINDNGSGSAVLLEVAEQMRRVRPRNKVRFAWWGAEESGLFGSNYYVANPSPGQLDRIALYLNFDMVGSRNYVRFVYDGDGSSFGLAGPSGSEAIEDFFEDFYADRGLASEPTEISFRSDYAAFFDAGIAFGGLFTGAEGIKTADQAAIYGGKAGEQYDPCYHEACDTFDNVALEVLDVNSDATAAAVFTYSRSTAPVNGG